jgi:hypothetical protein
VEEMVVPDNSGLMDLIMPVEEEAGQTLTALQGAHQQEPVALAVAVMELGPAQGRQLELLIQVAVAVVPRVTVDLK